MSEARVLTTVEAGSTILADYRDLRWPRVLLIERADGSQYYVHADGSKHSVPPHTPMKLPG